MALIQLEKLQKTNNFVAIGNNENSTADEMIRHQNVEDKIRRTKLNHNGMS